MGTEVALEIAEGAHCVVDGGSGDGGGVEAQYDWFFEAVNGEESSGGLIDADDCKFD